MRGTQLKVLDKGYVRLADSNLYLPTLGDDLSVVNAARASFMKESNELTSRDKNLLRFLAEHGHESPFRHAAITLEVKAPLMVARQWFKYRVGTSISPDTAELLGIAIPAEIAEPFWDYARTYLGFAGNGDDWGFSDLLYARNEASRRYVTLEPEFYIPDVWRSSPDNKKQGSGGPIEKDLQTEWKLRLADVIDYGMKFYHSAMETGICAEQARLFLPCYGLYTIFRWTASVQCLAHFLNQRLGEDSQWETQQYAGATAGICLPIFQFSLPKLIKVPTGETTCNQSGSTVEQKDMSGSQTSI